MSDNKKSEGSLAGIGFIVGGIYGLSQTGTWEGAFLHAIAGALLGWLLEKIIVLGVALLFGFILLQIYVGRFEDLIKIFTGTP